MMNSFLQNESGLSRLSKLQDKEIELVILWALTTIENYCKAVFIQFQSSICFWLEVKCTRLFNE